MALDEEDLSPAQGEALRMLREGRVTAPFVAEQTGYSLQYVREELTDLVKHDHVEKVHDGLYELVNDPRVETDRRPYSEESLESVRTFINGIEEEIEKAERGEVERNVEVLRDRRKTLRDLLEAHEQAHRTLEDDSGSTTEP